MIGSIIIWEDDEESELKVEGVSLLNYLSYWKGDRVKYVDLSMVY